MCNLAGQFPGLFEHDAGNVTSILTATMLIFFPPKEFDCFLNNQSEAEIISQSRSRLPLQSGGKAKCIQVSTIHSINIQFRIFVFFIILNNKLVTKSD